MTTFHVRAWTMGPEFWEFYVTMTPPELSALRAKLDSEVRDHVLPMPVAQEYAKKSKGTKFKWRAEHRAWMASPTRSVVGYRIEPVHALGRKVTPYDVVFRDLSEDVCFLGGVLVRAILAH